MQIRVARAESRPRRAGKESREIGYLNIVREGRQLSRDQLERVRAAHVLRLDPPGDGIVCRPDLPVLALALGRNLRIYIDRGHNFQRGQRRGGQCSSLHTPNAGAATPISAYVRPLHEAYHRATIERRPQHRTQ